MRTNGLLLERMCRSEEYLHQHPSSVRSTATSRALQLWLDSAVHDAMAPKIEVRVDELMQWADSKKGQRLLALAEVRRTSYYERPNHLHELLVGWMRRIENGPVLVPSGMLGWRVRCRYFSCFFRSWSVWRRSSGPAGARVCLRPGASCLRLRSFDGCHGQVRRCLSGWLTVVVGEGAAVECRENTCAGRMSSREEQTTKKQKKRGSTQQKKGKQ